MGRLSLLGRLSLPNRLSLPKPYIKTTYACLYSSLERLPPVLEASDVALAKVAMTIDEVLTASDAEL